MNANPHGASVVPRVAATAIQPAGKVGLAVSQVFIGIIASMSEVLPRPTIKIFVSSPGDVTEERLAAERVLRRLRDRYASEAIIEPVFWEHEPLRATEHFQEGIPLPSAMDVVVCILWSRLGTRMPADKFHRDDGTPYNSGSALTKVNPSIG